MWLESWEAIEEDERPREYPRRVHRINILSAGSVTHRSPQSYLVVGGDGLLGAEIRRMLSQEGEKVTSTTRRREPATVGRTFLDLAEGNPGLELRDSVDVAVFCAANASFAACDTEPRQTRQVNVVNTLRVADQLIRREVYVLVVSTNAVFDGTVRYPDESTRTCPLTAYGRQKAELEARILDLDRGRGLAGIVRLTKVVTRNLPSVQQIIQSPRDGRVARPFSDLMLSPITLEHAAGSISKLLRHRAPGIWHVSGQEELSYAGFCYALAGRLGIARDLICSTTSIEAGVKLLFKPAHPALGMKRTRQYAGIVPQPLEDVLATLQLAA